MFKGCAYPERHPLKGVDNLHRFALTFLDCHIKMPFIDLFMLHIFFHFLSIHIRPDELSQGEHRCLSAYCLDVCSNASLCLFCKYTDVNIICQWLVSQMNLEDLLTLPFSWWWDADQSVEPSRAKQSRVDQIRSVRRGYDDQKLRDMLRGRGVRPLIKHREFKPYDRAANARMDKELYGQRNMAETANSVIKRRYGDHVRSRKCHHQFREIIGKCIVYNIERAIKSLVLNIQAIIQKLFYKA
ncbi:MAG: hypothetical protein DDT40_01858 [candidate division WS2 bacterium]|nr:hypothetical protein [Candidatus Psychracetigena formicireducens]